MSQPLETQTLDFPRLPEVLTRVRARQSPVSALRALELKDGEELRDRKEKLESLIRTCRRTLSIWSPHGLPKDPPKRLRPRKLPKHLQQKDIVRILKDDMNKTKKLMLMA